MSSSIFKAPLNENQGSDIIKSIKLWRIWYSLSMQDILLRYRGSVLGPFWITLSMAITVFSMGFLYGVLFGVDQATYLPYFTTGMISWTFISMIVNESTKIMLESKPYMENIQLPCVLYLFRLVFRNIVVFAHNLPVYIIVALIYHFQFNANIFLLVPSLIILSVNAIFYGGVVAFISTRFPDVGTMVSSMLQILFFVTPIMWPPSALPIQYHIYLVFNPFVYYVNLIRKPLLGLSFDMSDLIGIAIITLLGGLLFTFTHDRFKKKVIFWM